MPSRAHLHRSIETVRWLKGRPICLIESIIVISSGNETAILIYYIIQRKQYKQYDTAIKATDILREKSERLIFLYTRILHIIY